VKVKIRVVSVYAMKAYVKSRGIGLLMLYTIHDRGEGSASCLTSLHPEEKAWYPVTSLAVEIRNLILIITF
jgi:hypothetical protein